MSNRQKEPVKYCEVVTLAGNTILDLHSMVYSQRPDGSYIRVNPHHLSEGDRIEFQREYAMASLDDIDTFLLDNFPRYGQAKRAVFRRNSKGIEVPLFRVMLWQGAKQKGLLQKGEKYVEHRALREGGFDFDDYEYRQAANGIYSAVNPRDFGYPSWDAILNWLEGKVKAPIDWKVFGILSEELSPEFREIYESEGKENGFWDMYKFYITRRQFVSSNIAGSHEPQEHGKKRYHDKGTGRYSIDTEMALLVPMFKETKRSGKFITEVVYVRVFEQERNAKARRQIEGHPRFRRGVVTNDPEADKNSIRLSQYTPLDIMGGINPFVDQSMALEKVKDFCIRTGFPLSMIRGYLLNTGRKHQAENSAKEFMQRTGLDYESMRQTLLAGIPENLHDDPDIEAMVIDNMMEICQGLQETVMGLRKGLTDFERNLESLEL